MLPAPKRAVERHQATPPLGGPSGRLSEGQRALACPTMERPSPCVPGPSAERGGVGAHHRLDVCASGRHLLAMGPGGAGPPGHRHDGIAAVAMDIHRPGCSGKIQVLRGVCSAQVTRTPQQRAPLLLARYGGKSTGRARPCPVNPPLWAPWGLGRSRAARPSYRTPASASP